jgi:mono/diheme cytochrome c family protein
MWLAAMPLLGKYPARTSPFAPPPPLVAQPGSTALNMPVLAFDAETKRYQAAPGESDAPFTFNLTNIWTNEVVIQRVQASCGCATASLPSSPWHLSPGAGGQVHAQMNLLGKMGLITKQLKFFLSAGTNNLTQTVNLEVIIPLPPALGGSLSAQERQAALAKAQLNPQAIFQGDCASCHVARGRNAYGQDLYAADCGICHESSHRASLVPDLHALKQPTDLDYWKTLITSGKPHSMMPAFAQAQGGPLSEAQITSLAAYLNHTLSHHLSPVLSNAAAPSVRTALIP